MLSMGWTFSSQGKKKRSRSARRDSSDEELCEENKSQRMSKISPKKKGGEKEKKSSKLVKPKNAYENFINTLEDNGELSERRADKYTKLLALNNKQSGLYKEMEKELKAGGEINMDRFCVLTAMYDKVGNNCHKRLNNLADTECKAVTYKSNSSSSDSSSPNTTVEEDDRAGK